MLAVVALFWAWSNADGLKGAAEAGQEPCRNDLRWLPDLGKTYQGFMKQLVKWHAELQVLCNGRTPHADEAGLVWALEECRGRGHGRGRESDGIAAHRRERGGVLARKRKKTKNGKEGRRKQGKSNRGKRSRKVRGRGPGIDLQEGQQPPDVVDAVLAPGDGIAVGLEDGVIRLQSARPPAGDVAGTAEKHADFGECRLMGYEFWDAVMTAGRSFVIRAGQTYGC